MKWTLRCAVVMVLSLQFGCTYNRVTQPVQDTAQEKKGLDEWMVESLNPTLRWEPVTIDGEQPHYDIVIYEAYALRISKTDHFSEKDTYHLKRLSRGERVYYQENLPSAQCTVSKTLKPDSDYFWTIRTRHKGKLSPWATIDKIRPYFQSAITDFYFRTPGQ